MILKILTEIKKYTVKLLNMKESHMLQVLKSLTIISGQSL